MNIKQVNLKELTVLRTLNQGGVIIMAHVPVLYDRGENFLEGLEPKLFISFRQRGYVEASPVPSFMGNRKYYITPAGRAALRETVTRDDARGGTRSGEAE